MSNQDIERARTLIRNAIIADIHYQPKVVDASTFQYIPEAAFDDTALVITALQGLELREDELSEIVRHYRCLLAIFLSGNGLLPSFPPLYRALKTAGKSDTDLPLDRYSLNALLNPGNHEREGDFLQSHTRVKEFFRAQCLLRPRRLGGIDTDPYDELEKLPFLSKDHIGEGSFGTVYRVRIPAGYLKDREGYANHEEKDFALKSLNAEDGEKELEVLRSIAACPRSHANVVYFSAAFKSQGHANIVLPLMTWGNLEDFLMGNHKAEGTHDLLETLQSPTSDHLAMERAKLDQISLVADALEHLHHNLGRYFAHLDLKPQNILIKPGSLDETLPVGRWCLSDFGISYIDPEERRAGTSYRPTPLRHILGNAGEYQAPEVRMGDEPKFSSRSDVWSLMCIFMEVFVHILGGSQEVKTFRTCRAHEHLDGAFCAFFPDKLHFDRSTSCLRDKIMPHVKQLSAKTPDNDQWKRCAITTMQRFLVKTSDNSPRPDSKELSQSLDHVSNHFAHSTAQPRCQNNYECPITRTERSRHAEWATQLVRLRAGATSPEVLPVLQQLAAEANQRSVWAWLTKRLSFKAVSINETLSTCAFLGKDGILRATRIDCQNRPVKVHENDPVHLSKEVDWKGVHCAGPYIAAWGSKPYSRRSSASVEEQVHVCEVEAMAQNVLPAGLPPFPESIRVSSKGCVVVLCAGELRAIFLRDRHRQWTTLRPYSEHHRFETGAFSDDARYFFAWSWGEGDEVLHVWDVGISSSLFTSLKAYAYTSNHGGNRPSISLLPFNQQKDCVMMTSAESCFALKKQAPRRSFGTSLGIKSVRGVVGAQIYRDASLITLDDNKRLFQHDILDSGENRIQEERLICTLQIKMIRPCSMRIKDDGENVIVAVCNAVGDLEIHHCSRESSG